MWGELVAEGSGEGRCLFGGRFVYDRGEDCFCRLSGTVNFFEFGHFGGFDSVD